MTGSTQTSSTAEDVGRDAPSRTPARRLSGVGDPARGGSVELTAAELWSRIQEAVRPAVPEQAYRTWLAGTRALGLSGDDLLLEAPSRFHVEWLEDKYGPLLTAAAQRILGRPLTMSVSCAPEPTPITVPTLELGGHEPFERQGAPVPPSPLPTPAPRPHLNERYTFERFVVGSNNQLAVAACRAVAEKPAKMYNPLFLYGGVGLGKTHLMHAIGHRLLADDPSRRVTYLSSEQFTNALVTSIQEGTMAAFRRRFRDMDLLLVDDIHFLEGKERTQEEFFHTFNALYDAQRQIILTSDRPPKEIPGLEARLISRFEWGLVVDIKPPDLETRMAILRKKAGDDGLALDDEVIEFIAHSCKASVRELEGAVIKLLAYSSLTHQEITLALARTALQGVLGRSRDEGPVLSPERIQDLVARRWRVKPEALASKRRTKDVTVPRQVAMYLIKEALGTSLVQIGSVFGGRDHSTVIHSLRKVEEEMARDPDFRKQVDEARQDIKNATRR
jgi:chromosomal replication initiator protein